MNSPLAIAIALLAAPAAAQLVQHDSLTAWTHAGGAPNWTDDVPHTGSFFGKVDQLNSIALLQYAGGTQTLQPGTYAVAARVMKFQDQAGVADLELLAVTQGSQVTVTLAAADQPTDQWVRTPYAIFSIDTPQSVAIAVLNTDQTVTKQNYYFDELSIGRIDLGPAVYYETMSRWGHAWGGDPRYYNGTVRDTDSAAGIAVELAQVWWLEFLPKKVPLPPGLYTANVRLKKTVSASGAVPVDLEVRLPGGPTRVTLPVADQPVDQYVYTPALVFAVGPNETPEFWFGNTQSTYKQNYHFDALIVRRGAYTTYGSGCASSLGVVMMTATTPVLGEPFTATVHNVGAGGGLLGFGAQRLNIDLGTIGLQGCWLLASIDAALPLVPNPGNVVEASFTIPNVAALAGSRFFNQAVVLDPAANPLGVATSNGGEAELSN